MVRTLTWPGSRRTGFPHDRGDGPKDENARRSTQLFSPRPWGWSVPFPDCREDHVVFPTTVGMVRPRWETMCLGISFPHDRGDGPSAPMIGNLRVRFSPRPWGWSGEDEAFGLRARVFPTTVGMVRCRSTSQCRRSCFPHDRGDGPAVVSTTSIGILFSPRPWGWSGPRVAPGDVAEVFPTTVGMVRNPPSSCDVVVRFPHDHGDDPGTFFNLTLERLFSPRSWGWSEPLRSLPAALAIFPTLVGMARTTTRSCAPATCFSHARGDGPMAMGYFDEHRPFFPRSWGWSAPFAPPDLAE